MWTLGYAEDFKRIVQIGIVVKDIERARATWAELLGVQEPPIVETEKWESTHMAFRGTPSKARAKLTFFNLENIALELIQPIGDSSTWQDFSEKHGEGIHHIAFNVKNLEGTLEKFNKMKIEVEQKGEYKGGCYVYTDSESKLGAIMELLHCHT